jgi:hypothetical protein
MSSRERQAWTEFVRKREELKDEKSARKQRAKEIAADAGGARGCA